MQQRVENLNQLTTRGYDIAVSYKYDIGEYGDLRFRADMTHVIEHSVSFVGNDGLEVVNNNGQLRTGIFEDVASASVSWRKDNWRVRWSANFRSSSVDDHDRVEDYLERFADNQALLDAGDPDAILNPEVPAYLFYGSFIRHNLSISYDLELDNDVEVRLFGGARNMFNNLGPLVANTGDNVERGRGNFSSEFDGGVGRFIFLGAELTF